MHRRQSRSEKQLTPLPAHLNVTGSQVSWSQMSPRLNWHTSKLVPDGRQSLSVRQGRPEGPGTHSLVAGSQYGKPVGLWAATGIEAIAKTIIADIKAARVRDLRCMVLPLFLRCSVKQTLLVSFVSDITTSHESPIESRTFEIKTEKTRAEGVVAARLRRGV